MSQEMPKMRTPDEIEKIEKNRKRYEEEAEKIAGGINEEEGVGPISKLLRRRFVTKKEDVIKSDAIFEDESTNLAKKIQQVDGWVLRKEMFAELPKLLRDYSLFWSDFKDLKNGYTECKIEGLVEGKEVSIDITFFLDPEFIEGASERFVVRKASGTIDGKPMPDELAKEIAEKDYWLSYKISQVHDSLAATMANIHGELSPVGVYDYDQVRRIEDRQWGKPMDERFGFVSVEAEEAIRRLLPLWNAGGSPLDENNLLRTAESEKTPAEKRKRLISIVSGEADKLNKILEILKRHDK